MKICMNAAEIGELVANAIKKDILINGLKPQITCKPILSASSQNDDDWTFEGFEIELLAVEEEKPVE